MHREIESAVRNSRLFYGLSECAVKQIAAQCELVRAPMESTVWVEGQPTEFFALIRKGIVCMSQGREGSRVTVELLGAGDSTGLLATLGMIPHPLNAVSLADTTYVRVPSVLWRTVCHDEPRMFEHAVVEVVPRLLGGFRFMATMSQGEISTRLATVVLRMAELSARSHGPEAPLMVTRRVLAEVAGTTVETAIRVTSRWKSEGWVTSGHGKLSVLDHSALVAVSEGRSPDAATG